MTLAVLLRDNAKAIATGIGFSAGIMLLISLVKLIPQSAVAIGVPFTLLSVALGTGLIWSAHVMIPHRHLVEEGGIVDRRLMRSAYLVAFGPILHDVPEGFAMANGYIASPGFGLLVPMARRYRQPGRFLLGMLLSVLVYILLTVLIDGDVG